MLTVLTLVALFGFTPVVTLNTRVPAGTTHTAFAITARAAAIVNYDDVTGAFQVCRHPQIARGSWGRGSCWDLTVSPGWTSIEADGDQYGDLHVRFTHTTSGQTLIWTF